MAEVSKSRLALDLEEIERQLRHSSQQPGSSRSDPLAELARIVGQDDPFRALLSAEKSPSTSAAPGNNIFGRREPLFDDSGYAQGGALAHDLRGSLGEPEPDPSTAYRDYAYALTAEENAILRGQQDPRFSQVLEESDLYYQDGGSYAEPESTFAPVEPRRSRKGMIAVGVVLGAALLGTAGALTLRPGSLTGFAGGEPPIVKAETGPSKVAPLNPGGVDIPNQNKQIYERASQDTNTRVVDREEQPVDVRQAARTAASAPETTAGSASVRLSPAVPPSASANSIPSSLQGTSNSAVGLLGEPRRVRTVSIRPDGTIVMPEQGGLSGSGTPPASLPFTTMARPNASAAPAPAAPVPAPSTVSSTAPSAASSATSSTPVSPQVPQVRTAPQRPRDVTTTPVAPRAAASGTSHSIGAPLQITSEAVRPRSDSRIASAPQAILREPTETSAAPTASGFSVQLAFRSTEREARATFEQLQQRYASELSGFSPMIRQAEINGKTAYRLRVGPLSRDDAASLCSRLKAAGGQCFVANN